MDNERKNNSFKVYKLLHTQWTQTFFFMADEVVFFLTIRYFWAWPLLKA